MKFRNEIILAVCFIAGNFVASGPANVTDYAERSKAQAQATSVASATQAPDGLLARANSASALARR